MTVLHNKRPALEKKADKTDFIIYRKAKLSIVKLIMLLCLSSCFVPWRDVTLLITVSALLIKARKYSEIWIHLSWAVKYWSAPIYVKYNVVS